MTSAAEVIGGAIAVGFYAVIGIGALWLLWWDRD